MPVAVFSLEMGAQQLVQRLLCSRAKVNLGRVRDGFLAERDFPALTAAASKLAESKIFIDDTSGLSILELRAKARRLKSQHDIKAIFIDYLQLLRSTSRRAQDNRQLEIAEISAGLKGARQGTAASHRRPRAAQPKSRGAHGRGEGPAAARRFARVRFHRAGRRPRGPAHPRGILRRHRGGEGSRHGQGDAHHRQAAQRPGGRRAADVPEGIHAVRDARGRSGVARAQNRSTPAPLSPLIVRMAKPVVLIIRDGWGINPGGRAQAVQNGDATMLAQTPFHDHLYATYPRGTLSASGMDVGLPEGQMGNSEVGHLNLGAGRIVYQDLTRINKAIADGELATNPVLVDTFAKAKGRRLHLLGLVSDGGVHSHVNHLIALVKAAHDAGVADIMIHAITDGRDTSPTGGADYLAALAAQSQRPGGDRHGYRALLRDGPRQALGAQQTRVGRHRPRPRRGRRRNALGRAHHALREGRDRRVFAAGHPFARQRAARPRRRHDPLLQLSRRPRPAAFAGVFARRFQRLRPRSLAARPLRHAHRIRRDLRRADRLRAAIARAAARRSRERRRPETTAHRGDGEIPARHLFLQRRRRETESRARTARSSRRRKTWPRTITSRR